MNSKSTVLVIVNSISLAIMLFLNYASNAGIFSDTNVAAISHKYDTLFAPAGYAFSIWGLIFLFCIGFVSYQWVLQKKGDPQQYITRTGVWFTLGNIVNGLWLFCWTNEMMALSVVLIVVLLVSLCVLSIRLQTAMNDPSIAVKIFVWWPIVIYLGWIMVATVACIAAWLVSTGWRGDGIGEATVTIAMIVVAALIYLFIIGKHNLTQSAMVGVWAFVAIAVRQQNDNNNIALAASIVSGILSASIISRIYVNKQHEQKLKTPR